MIWWRISMRRNKVVSVLPNYRSLLLCVDSRKFKFNRRDARVAEWGGLENRCPPWRTQGSNPCLSAFARHSFSGGGLRFLGISSNSGGLRRTQSAKNHRKNACNSVDFPIDSLVDHLKLRYVFLRLYFKMSRQLALHRFL